MAEKLKSFFQLPKKKMKHEISFFSLFFVFETATEIHFACLWLLFYLIATAATITQSAHRKPFLHSRLCVIRAAAASWLAMGFAFDCMRNVNIIIGGGFFFIFYFSSFPWSWKISVEKKTGIVIPNNGFKVHCLCFQSKVFRRGILKSQIFEHDRPLFEASAEHINLSNSCPHFDCSKRWGNDRQVSLSTDRSVHSLKFHVIIIYLTVFGSSSPFLSFCFYFFQSHDLFKTLHVDIF